MTRIMIDHCGDFGGGTYSIHKNFANCIATTPGSNNGHMVLEMENNDSKKKRIKYRIRKLTPIECFKLMGMTKEDCEKAAAVGTSNTQLFRCAGNGLITNCITLIMEHLFKAQYDSEYKCFDERFLSGETANFTQVAR